MDAFKPRRDFALPVADALCPPGEHRVTRVCGLVEEAEKAADHATAPNRSPTDASASCKFLLACRAYSGFNSNPRYRR